MKRYFTTEEKTAAAAWMINRRPLRSFEVFYAGGTWYGTREFYMTVLSEYFCCSVQSDEMGPFTEDVITEGELLEPYKVSPQGVWNGLPEFLPVGSIVTIADSGQSEPRPEGKSFLASLRYTVSFNRVFAGMCEEIILKPKTNEAKTNTE